VCVCVCVAGGGLRWGGALQMTIQRVKERVQSNCGTSPSAMTLQLKDWHNQLVCTMDDNSKMLGYFSPEDGYVAHPLITTSPRVSCGGLDWTLTRLSLCGAYVR
jgi:hypothetical protein